MLRLSCGISRKAAQMLELPHCAAAGSQKGDTTVCPMVYPGVNIRVCGSPSQLRGAGANCVRPVRERIATTHISWGLWQQ